MASIQERVGRSGTVAYRVQFRIDGRMCSESFPQRAGAEQFGRLVDTIGGARAREVLRARQKAGGDTPTLRQFTERYLDPSSGLLTGVSDGTREEYRRIANRSFLPVLGDYPVDAIQKPDVGKWVSWQEQRASAKGTPVAAKTVRNYHSLLSSIMSAAVQEGLRDANPAHRTRLTKGRHVESVFLTPDEFTTLLHFIPPYYKRFVLFLAGTGCRWGEATAATWGAVNLKATPATIRIDRAWKKGASTPVLGAPKSHRANRTISLSRDVVTALGEPGSSDDLLFPGKLSGGHLWHGRFRASTWLPAVRAAQDERECAEAGLEPLWKTPTPHDLRHSHASWLIAAGVPLPLVQARLGHESIQTTVNVYGHLLPDAHLLMADVVAETMAGSMRAIE